MWNTIERSYNNIIFNKHNNHSLLIDFGNVFKDANIDIQVPVITLPTLRNEIDLAIKIIIGNLHLYATLPYVTVFW